MDPQVIDRRSEPRFSAAAFDVQGATLRPGCTVRVIDVSPAGAQLQSDRPLRPGRWVHVRMWGTGGTIAVSALILRCSVWALDQEEGVTYRAALRFDQRVPAWTRVAEGRAGVPSAAARRPSEPAASRPPGIPAGMQDQAGGGKAGSVRCP